jgi:hypothetical protein
LNLEREKHTTYIVVTNIGVTCPEKGVEVWTGFGCQKFNPQCLLRTVDRIDSKEATFKIKFLPKRKNLALAGISDVDVNSTNLSTRLKVEVCGQFHDPAIYPQVHNPPPTSLSIDWWPGVPKTLLVETRKSLARYQC